MWRRLLRSAARGEIDITAQQPRADEDSQHTYTHDTVLAIPQPPDEDTDLLKAIGRDVLGAIVSGDELTGELRQKHIEKALGDVKSKYGG